MTSDSFSPVTLASSIRLNNSLAVVALTILYYDYSLTFSREIDHFWKRARLSWVSTLFVVNRYIGLLGPIPVVLEYFVRLSSELQHYHQYYAIVSQVVVGVILILRTWALYNRSRYMLVALVVLGVVLVTGTVVAGNVKTQTVTENISSERPEPIFGCDLSLSSEQGLRSAIGWIAMLCLDTTIFMLTLFKTVHMRHTLNQGLLLILFRDGAIYYGILVVANIANILTFLAPNIGDSNRGLATTFTNALSSTLISRICLNLRDPGLLGGARWGGRLSLTEQPQSMNNEQTGMSFWHPVAAGVSEGDIMLASKNVVDSSQVASTSYDRRGCAS